MDELADPQPTHRCGLDSTRREQKHAGLVRQCISATPRTGFSRLGRHYDLHVKIYGLVEDGTVSAPAMTCALRAFAPSSF